jgi:hypothetical protein
MEDFTGFSPGQVRIEERIGARIGLILLDLSISPIKVSIKRGISLSPSDQPGI